MPPAVQSPPMPPPLPLPHLTQIAPTKFPNRPTLSQDPVAHRCKHRKRYLNSFTRVGGRHVDARSAQFDRPQTCFGHGRLAGSSLTPPGHECVCVCVEYRYEYKTPDICVYNMRAHLAIVVVVDAATVSAPSHS